MRGVANAAKMLTHLLRAKIAWPTSETSTPMTVLAMKYKIRKKNAKPAKVDDSNIFN